MLSRCPECATTFRVTPEQLKARAGKVRCGQCQQVFNAIEELLDEPTLPRESAGVEAGGTLAAEAPSAHPADEFDVSAAGVSSVDIELDFDPQAEQAVTPPFEAPGEPALEDDAAPSPETVLQEAQEAGLVAARDTREARGYSKWAETPLSGLDSSFAAAPTRARWPFVLASLLLLATLTLQAAYHFRSELAAGWPESRPHLVAACQVLACEVPLPRHAEQISIEGSELQVDAGRGGLLVLQATLKNRAATPQQLPSLELTLTDVQDRPVIRRVLAPADYLPPRTAMHTAFAAGGELSAKLWIDARETGAAGYRLYVFYP